MPFKVAAAFSPPSLVFLTLSGVRDVSSGDWNISKHAKKCVSICGSWSKSRELWLLEWWKCGIILLSWGERCSKTCAASVRSTASQNTSPGKTTLGSNGACMHVFVRQRWKRIVSRGLSYRARDSSRSGGGWEDDTSRSTCTRNLRTHSHAGRCSPHTSSPLIPQQKWVVFHFLLSLPALRGAGSHPSARR